MLSDDKLQIGHLTILHQLKPSAPLTDNDTMALLDFLRKRLEGADAGVLRDMVQFMAEGMMSAEPRGAEVRSATGPPR